MAIKPRDDEKIDSFTDYILNNYVDNDVAQFPPNVWSDFSATTNRTTISCESFHSKLNVFFSFGSSKYFYSCGHSSENILNRHISYNIK
ncbi:Reverse transcriptase domain-containing protein [Aphis craccivora]|uniref:Reverse transcriptase domain-containing protein n=1 Tax=Aphis craccivora TaxID=307492 RepID=A0A6G0YZK2_APHCR|nr:Reverse transcriptase domain-containing protein [Aphis craccivora]